MCNHGNIVQDSLRMRVERSAHALLFPCPFQFHLLSARMAEPPVAKKPRFGTSTDEERLNLVSDAIPNATRAKTNVFVHAFESYLEGKGKSVDFRSVAASDLADVLFGFYTDLKTQKGELYKADSMKCCRSATNRHTQQFQPTMSIIDNPEFKTANKVLDSVELFSRTENPKDWSQQLSIRSPSPIRTGQSWQNTSVIFFRQVTRVS